VTTFCSCCSSVLARLATWLHRVTIASRLQVATEDIILQPLIRFLLTVKTCDTQGRINIKLGYVDTLPLHFTSPYPLTLFLHQSPPFLPLPLGPFLSLLSRFPSHPLLPLKSRPPKIHLRGLWERCKLPKWGLGRSPSRNRISCILTLKYDIWWQQF